MKNKKMLFSLLAVGILSLVACKDPTESTPSVEPTTPVESTTPEHSSTPEQSTTPEDSSTKEFEAVALDVVKSTYKNNQEVQVEGIVYGVTKNGFFVTDAAKAGIFVNMGDNWTSTVKIGSKVQITAKYSLVSGYSMLKQATVTVASENETVPVTSVEKEFSFISELAASASGDYGMLVKLSGTLSEGSGGAFVLTDDTGATIDLASISAAHLATFVGKRITLEAVVYKTDTQGKWQLVFAGDESDIVDATLTFEDYVALAKKELDNLIPSKCVGNLPLPTAHSVDSQMTYSWVVKSGTSVTITDNVATVVPPTADEEVVLTVTITREGQTSSFDYTITSKAVVEQTVAEFVAGDSISGDAVKVTGVVVAMGRNQGNQNPPYDASKRYVVVQDETTLDSIPVNYYYSSTDHGFEGLSIGDKITIDGNWSDEKGETQNPIIEAKSISLVSENVNVADAKESAVVISTKEQYEDLGENPSKYTGKLLKFDNPYITYSTTGEPNPSNWVRFGYDSSISTVGNRSLATLIGLGNENIDEGWDKHFDIANLGEEATQFAGDIYAYLVYRSGSYLQLCIPSVSYIALDSADQQAAYEEVCNLPDSINCESQFPLTEGLTYAFEDNIEGSDIIDENGNVGLALSNIDVAVTVTKGEFSFTKNITVISATTYSLSVGTETNGTTTLSKTEGLLEDEEVTATFAPAEGYVTVSYTITCGDISTKYTAYKQESATIKVPGDAVITVEYASENEYASFNYASGTSRQYFYVDGKYYNSSDVEYAYEDVMASIKDSEGNPIDSTIFGIEPITTFEDGKWANLYYSKNGYGLNFYADEVTGAYSGAKFTSTRTIQSITITYYGATYYTRALVESNGKVLEGTLVDEATYTYLVDAKEFSITNISKGNNLYIPGIEIVYCNHGYEHNDTQHWAECTKCDFKVENTNHELVDGVCVCGYSELCNITVGTETNGVTTLSSNTAAGGSEVTATFAPAEGYVVVAYSLTVGEETTKIAAYNVASASFELSGDTVVTAEYAKASSFKLENDATDKVYIYNVGGTWTSGASTTGLKTPSEENTVTYDYVIGEFRDCESNSIDSNVFAVSGKTMTDGKWLLLQSDASSSVAGNNMCLYGDKNGEYTTDIKFTSTETIYSVTVVYGNETHFGRAKVYSGETELTGTVVSTVDGYSVTYLIDSKDFTIENVGHQYLYLNAVEIVYATPASAE